MLTYTAAGTPREVSDYLDDFRRVTDADELITIHQVSEMDGRLRSVTLLAEAMQTVTT
jgi:putative transposase